MRVGVVPLIPSSTVGVSRSSPVLSRAHPPQRCRTLHDSVPSCSSSLDPLHNYFLDVCATPAPGGDTAAFVSNRGSATALLRCAASSIRVSCPVPSTHGHRSSAACGGHAAATVRAVDSASTSKRHSSATAARYQCSRIGSTTTTLGDRCGPAASGSLTPSFNKYGGPTSTRAGSTSVGRATTCAAHLR